MQYELQVFRDEEEQDFRTIHVDGEPWFVLADVCRALGLSAHKGTFWRHAEKLDEDERQTLTLPPTLEGGGGTKFIVINESGLFSLILRSNKPAARKFRRWVTSVVLPSIRKTGGYGKPVSADWQPFHDRISAVWGAVPPGYFSVFKEMAELTGQLITSGVSVDHHTIPDISVGLAWGKFWIKQNGDSKYGPRRRYAHSYPPSFPQAWSNPQDAHCYPDEALGAFRHWFRSNYRVDSLPRYLITKIKKGEISHRAANAVLTATGLPIIASPK